MKTLLLTAVLALFAGCASNATLSDAMGVAPRATTGDGELAYARGSRAYVVSALDSDLEKRWTAQLVSYLGEVLRAPAAVVPTVDDVPVGESAIVLERGFAGVSGALKIPLRSHTDEDFALLSSERSGHPVLIAAAAEPNGMRRAIQRIIISSQQHPQALTFPRVAKFFTPWIESREFEPSAWQPNYVRAKFWNPAVDARLDYQAYDDEQLMRYIGMFDWFGFNGIRVEDGAWQWAIFGTQESAGDFVRRVSRIAKSQHMNRTLHVLYADFHGYGWSDPSVKYQPEVGKTAYQDADVRATFERAYDYYADLAPDFDRIGGHLIDPGYLRTNADMVAYVKLFRDKVRKRNPDIALDVVMWATELSLAEDFIAAGISDLNILFSNNPYRWRTEEKQKVHSAARFAGLSVGYWSWGLTDAEQDFTPSMYVNPSVIGENYRMVRDAVQLYHAPVYWSEMEAYHLLNIFSMYVSGQLLWDPDRDPHSALWEGTTAIWGPDNGGQLYDVLTFIEEFRSAQYWKLRPTFGSADPAADLRRAELAIETLQALWPDTGFVAKIPLPVAPQVITELMIPHLRQIADFSRFRIELQAVEKRAAEGASTEEIKALLQRAWQPVPEYNTWIGTPGPIEYNAQLWLLEAMERRFQINVKDPQWLIEQDASRILQTLRGRQGYSAQPVTWQLLDKASSSWDSDSLIDVNFYSLARYGRPGWRDRVDLLLARADLVKVSDEDGKTWYRLSDWKPWAHPANSPEPYPIQRDRRSQAAEKRR